jgi:ribosomal-protein-alanine N-acetyltransferase
MQNRVFSQEFPIIDLSEHLILREQRVSDYEDFYNYISKPIVKEYILSPLPNSLEDSKEELNYWNGLFYKRSGIYWAIAIKKSDRMIGSIGFHEINYINNRAEISYDLTREAWGKGIMSLAMNKVLDFGFGNMGINRIQASTVKENVASIKLLERCGFQKEGVLRNYRRHKQKFYDIEFYSLLAND